MAGVRLLLVFGVEFVVEVDQVVVEIIIQIVVVIVEVVVIQVVVIESLFVIPLILDVVVFIIFQIVLEIFVLGIGIRCPLRQPRFRLPLSAVREAPRGRR